MPGYSSEAGRQNVAAVAPAAPDFLIKYEPINGHASPPGMPEEETVIGSESDAVDRIRDLIENGRTTPGRVRLYANTCPRVEVSVTFPNRMVGSDAPARR